MRKHSLKQSFSFAGDGLLDSLKEEANLRIHLSAGALVLLWGEVLQLSALHRAVLVICIAVVIAAELFNTALEAVVDLCTQQIHPLARKAKNVAAGAVLVCALGAAGAGVLLLVPQAIQKLPELFTQAPQRSFLFWPGAILTVLGAGLLVLNAALRRTAAASAICALVAALCSFALHLHPTLLAATFAALSLLLTGYARTHNAHHTPLSVTAGLGLGSGAACILLSML